MEPYTQYPFTAELFLIGINPYVFVPEQIRAALFVQAGKSAGPIPVCGTLNTVPYRQTLVKYRGEWRLYVNTGMLPKSPQRIGEHLALTIAFDPADRSLPVHPKLAEALSADSVAGAKFARLSPSLRHEIVRYIDRLKTEESVDRNVARAIRFLRGEGRFAGRS